MTPSGNVGIGMTNPQYPLDVIGALRSYYFITNNGAIYNSDRISFVAGSTFYIVNQATVGVYLTSGQTSWGAQSDERTKRDIVPIENCIEKLQKIKGVFYNYKTDEATDRKRVGVIAQDVLEALPEIVDIDEKTNMYNVRMVEIVPLLVSGINELKNYINTLEKRIIGLESRF